MRKSKSASYIVLRKKPTVRTGLNELDVITEHNSVFDKAGSVAVGKFGVSWHQSKCDEFSACIKNGSTIYLLLVSRTAKGFNGFRARIRDIQLANNKILPQFPPYYNLLNRQPSLRETALATKPSMWFRIAERLKPYPLLNLSLLTNKRPLLDVLNECRTTMMLVVDSRKENN